VAAGEPGARILRMGGAAMWIWFVVTFYAGMLAGLFIAGLMHAAARGDGR